MALNRPEIWKNDPTVLYHGTLRRSAASVVRGIDPRYFKPLKDFGRGFYVTTSRRQAASWAEGLVDQHASAEEPAVLAVTVDLDELAQLEILSFVRGDYDAEAYWSLVWRCREDDVDHGRSMNSGWYDVVMGPVAAFWKQREAFASGDQMSFHTPAAVALLNRSTPRIVA